MTARAKPRISVVGGGFSGLTAAAFLQDRGFAVRIYEAKQWGGCIQTNITPQMHVESAANAFLNTPLLADLAAAIGCAMQPVRPTGRMKYIFRDGLNRWPLSVESTARILFRTIPRLVRTPNLFKPRPRETVREWALRLFNQEFLDYILGPALQGIYAGDINRLSATLTVGSMFANKRKFDPFRIFKPRGSVAPIGGMSDFIHCLRAHLKNRGAEMIVEEVKSLSEIEGARVLAVPIQQLMHFKPELHSSDLEMVNLARVTVGFESRAVTKIRGFGVLIPHVEGYKSLGVLANSQIFSNRGVFYNESWMLGGACHPQILALSDTQIVELIQGERKHLLGDHAPIDIHQVIRCPQAYVHYDVGLERWLEAHQDKFLNADGHEWITGNYLGQIGLSKILQRNWDLARTIESVLCPK